MPGAGHHAIRNAPLLQRAALVGANGKKRVDFALVFKQRDVLPLHLDKFPAVLGDFGFFADFYKFRHGRLLIQKDKAP